MKEIITTCVPDYRVNRYARRIDKKPFRFDIGFDVLESFATSAKKNSISAGATVYPNASLLEITRTLYSLAETMKQWKGINISRHRVMMSARQIHCQIKM